MGNILVASLQEEAVRVIQGCFQPANKVHTAPSREAVLGLLQKKRCDFIFVDIDLLRDPTQGNGLKSTLQAFWHLAPTAEIIVMSSLQQIREAVMIVKAGASNYLTYPLTAEEVRYVTESLRESVIMASELDYLRDRFWQIDSLDVLQTKSPRMKRVFEEIRSVAPTKSTVLLSGGTGTGKGVMARLIHRHSDRRAARFISVHCGAIPDTLVESELFGYEKGAFTGATRRKLGRFEIAQRGTIFLDEIGTISAAAQIKLLQVLQDGIFQRVGGEENLEADVRVIAATNMDLNQMCEKGLFRRDLYYRLNVFPIEIPLLRERSEDIPLLAEVFLRRLNKFNPKGIHHVDDAVMQALMDYPWPGNIRELENLLERAYILERSPVLTPESFPSELFDLAAAAEPAAKGVAPSLAEVRRKAAEEVEKRYLRELLSQTGGSIRNTAARAGITERQLHKLMQKHGLHKEEFKIRA